MPQIQIMIQNQAKYYQPVVCEGIQLSWERKGVPGKLTFKVVNDAIIDFVEGNCVTMSVDNTNVFLGYVFTKDRDKDNIITVTAYDQLRYLKNKEIKNYSNKRADEIIQEIATDFNLKLGELEDTVYKIPLRRDSNQALIDIILTALDVTQQNTKQMYVLYDDFGKLMLKNADKMRVDILVDAETAENFSYTSSIDKDTYNKIKLYFDNKEAKVREVYLELDSTNIKRWGVLQLTDSIDEQQLVNARQLAQQLLAAYNTPTRSLNITGAFGDIRVRGGASIGVALNLGDIVLATEYMLVETVTHTFTDNEHTMDLKLRGGLINV